MKLTTLFILSALPFAAGCGGANRYRADPDVKKADDPRAVKPNMLGGDPVSMMFTDARFTIVDALRKMDVAKLSGPDNGAMHSAATWLQTNKFGLAEDVDGLPHTWSKDTEAECAAMASITRRQTKISLIKSRPQCLVSRPTPIRSI